MKRQQRNSPTGMYQLVDLAVLALCFYGAYQTKLLLPDGFGGLQDGIHYDAILLIALFSIHLSLRLFGVYALRHKHSPKEMLSRLLQGTMTGTAGTILICYLLNIEGVSRLLMMLSGLYGFAGLAAVKAVICRLQGCSKNNRNIRHILVVGSRQRAVDFIRVVSSRPETGYRIIGCLETVDLAGGVGNRVYRDVKIIGTLESFRDILKRETIDEVVFGMPLNKIENVHDYIYYAEEMGKNIRVLPDLQIPSIQFFPLTGRARVEDFLGATTLALTIVPEDSGRRPIKAYLDYVVAGIRGQG